MSARVRALGIAGAFLVLAALAVSWSASSRYGLGIDADAVWCVSAAENLLAGRGLVTCRDQVLSLWPPLYSLVIAGLGALGIDALGGLRVLHLTALALTLMLSARLAFRLSGSHWAALATVGSLALSSRMHEFTIQVLSETFFVPLVLGALLVALAHLEAPSSRRFIALIVLSALACLQRYLGVALVATLATALALHEEGSFVRRVRCAALFAVPALAPLVAWFVRNYLLERTLTGGRDDPPAEQSNVLLDAFATVQRWAAPDGAPSWLGSGVLLAAFALVTWAFADRTRAFRTPLGVVVGFTAAYLALLLSLAAVVRIDRVSDRLLFPVLPLMVAIGWACVFRFARSRATFTVSAVLVAALWTAGGLRLVGFVQRWRTDGAGTLHTRMWQEHSVTRALRETRIEGPCWSNAPELVWLIQRVSVRFARTGPKVWERVGQQARLSGGTLAWFQHDGRPRAHRAELERAVRTTPIREFDEGLLLRLHAQSER